MLLVLLGDRKGAGPVIPFSVAFALLVIAGGLVIAFTDWDAEQ